jgi:ATP-binding cassette subfamily B protein
LWVTHDIAETEGFARVLVVDGGQIVEDASPTELAAREDSRYASLLRGDRELRSAEWAGGKWRKIWMSEGKIHEEARISEEDAS